MNITYIRLKKNIKEKIDLSDIPDGTVFSGKVEDYPSGIFLKSYRSVISLSRDGEIWYDRSTLDIQDYEKLDAELTIRRK